MYFQIMYHERWAKIFGSPLSALLLAAVRDGHYGNHNEPFSCFATPCDSELYEKGKSFSESLGFTPREFNTALKPIGTKVKNGTHRAALKRIDGTESREELIKRLVLYWEDFNGITWWEPNDPAYEESLGMRSVRRGFGDQE